MNWLPFDRLHLIERHYKSTVRWRYLFSVGRRYSVLLVRADRGTKTSTSLNSRGTP